VKAGFAGLLGLVLGASLVLLTESMDTRIRTPNEAEGAFGVPVLASIPTMNSGSYRQLTAATSGVANLVIPLLLVLLVLAVIGGLYISQVKAMPDSITQVGQALMQTFHSVR
jgi:capsular polysaccharide biosynthesis protein